MDERKTALETALVFADGVICKCGNRMQLKERANIGACTTDFYLLCEACKKHTRMRTIGRYEPLAKYIDVINEIKREI